MNILSLLIIFDIKASKVEMWYGKSMLLGVLLITGLSGNLLCAVLQNLPLVSVGASGALLVNSLNAFFSISLFMYSFI